MVLVENGRLIATAHFVDAFLYAPIVTNDSMTQPDWSPPWLADLQRRIRSRYFVPIGQWLL